jgi:hypothetical protein
MAKNVIYIPIHRRHKPLDHIQIDKGFACSRELDTPSDIYPSDFLNPDVTQGKEETKSPPMPKV